METKVATISTGGPSSREAEPRRQERALRTRQELIGAARRVFAADGFEPARLETIAAEAGKTRGAFYDHFHDKEDVFLAIFEEDLLLYREQVSRALEGASTRAERIEVLAAHLYDVLQDRRRMLLALEFKMYAIRQPERKQRLTDLQLAMCFEGTETGLSSLMPELQNRTHAQARAMNAQLGAVLDGLFVSSQFDPQALSEESTRGVLRTAISHMLAELDA